MTRVTTDASASAGSTTDSTNWVTSDSATTTARTAHHVRASGRERCHRVSVTPGFCQAASLHPSLVQGAVVPDPRSVTVAAVQGLPGSGIHHYNSGMETWDAIRSRRNVRQYTDQPIARDGLERVLEAGRRAP